jgi:hypothetical protein
MKSVSNQNFTNGIKQGYVNVKIFLAQTPKPIVGVTALSYEEVVDTEALYGIGNQPIGFGYGNYSYTGSIDLYHDEVESLQLIALAQGDNSGSITSILPFDIIVIISKFDSSTVSKHVLKNCIFQSNGRTLASGDASIKVSIPFMFSHINWI